MRNGTDGLRAVYEVDRPADRAVRGRPFRLAKFGHGELGPSGRRVLAAPDGGSLYAAGEGGVVRLGAKALDVQRRFLPMTSVDGLALTPDGRTLFALTVTGGRIARLDTATGQLEGWVGDGGFDRLLGATPWQVVRPSSGSTLTALSGFSALLEKS